MKTALITGASAGLGREFVGQLKANFPQIGALWLVARRKERLEALAAEYAGDFAVKTLPLDLCDKADLQRLADTLSAEKPTITLLVNNAGCGYLGDVAEMDAASQTRMTDLNVTALTAVTTLVLPYVAPGGRILNVSSIASFCPNPRMTVYSATKAYVSAFSRGLGDELRGRNVTVTALCPGPMDTEFLDLAGISGNSKTFDTLPHCDPAKVVAGAYRAAKAGKAVYTPKAFFKFYRFVAKIFPHAVVVKWART